MSTFGIANGDLSETQGSHPSSAEDQGTKRLMTAVGNALRPVLRQMEESDDPLLRTQLTQWVVATHLRPTVGIAAPE